MNILLDTHVLLWWLTNTPRLGAQARKIIGSRNTSVWVSSACVWEISIKAALGRLELREPFAQAMPAELEREGFRPLTITHRHAFKVRTLPPHHGDPFDRMLIAQAQCEDLTLVTADTRIAAYDVRTLDASA